MRGLAWAAENPDDGGDESCSTRRDRRARNRATASLRMMGEVRSAGRRRDRQLDDGKATTARWRTLVEGGTRPSRPSPMGAWNHAVTRPAGRLRSRAFRDPAAAPARSGAVCVPAAGTLRRWPRPADRPSRSDRSGAGRCGRLVDPSKSPAAACPSAGCPAPYRARAVSRAGRVGRSWRRAAPSSGAVTSTGCRGRAGRT